MEQEFRQALDGFIKAGHALVGAWDDGNWNADAKLGVPVDAKGEALLPHSLDEWLLYMQAHYEEKPPEPRPDPERLVYAVCRFADLVTKLLNGEDIYCEADDGRAHQGQDPFPKAVVFASTPDDPYPVPLCDWCDKTWR